MESVYSFEPTGRLDIGHVVSYTWDLIMGTILGNFHTAFPEITSILTTVTSMTIHHILTGF